MIGTIFMFSLQLSPIQNFLNLLMLIKVPVHEKLKMNFLKSDKSYGKNTFDLKAIVYLTVGGASLEILKQYIETQGQKE
jgi:REP element-mobilizing transposase RayT